MKKALIVQPGAFGDIIVCAPIAKYYHSRGYEVFWPAREKFRSVIDPLDYVNFIKLSEDVLHSDWLRSDVMKIIPSFNSYDLVLNLADRGPHKTAEMPNENFEECKYRLSNVPFLEKNRLVWRRDIKKEDFIYNTYVISKEYAFVHNTSSHEEIVKIPHTKLPIVKCEAPDGYNIYDWYKVAINASEIYCTESSIWAFLDGICDKLTPDRYLLSRSGLYGGASYTKSPTWKRDYLI